MSLLPFILLSVAVFTGVILALVAVLSLVESRIAAKGAAKIVINDGAKILDVDTGKSLLSTLSSQEIYLASACGGKGTCGECRCKVVGGGGEILPTETGILSRREQKEGLRLACQCKVRQDMRLDIPPEILDIKKYECTVLSNRNVATFIKELVLEIPEPLAFKPGQYIQIDVPPYELKFGDFDVEERFRHDWDKYGFWALVAENEEEVSRAYSMANHPAEVGRVILNVRIATPPPNKMQLPPGIASSYIFNLKSQDKIRISGPFGEFFIKDSEREMIYVGGGAGMAPLRSHLFHLLCTLNSGRNISYWYGARSKREIFYEEDFRALEKDFENFSFHIALSDPLPEDNWDGKTGFIHQVLFDEYLKHHDDPEEIEYYMCGPPMMIAAVNRMLDSLGVEPEMIAFDDFGE